MLKGIDLLLSAEVLGALCAMGNGDDRVICDTNFPAHSFARRTVLGSCSGSTRPPARAGGQHAGVSLRAVGRQQCVRLRPKGGGSGGVGAIAPTAHDLGLSNIFVGVFVVAIPGNDEEHSSAITAALKNRMDLSLSIATSRSAGP